MATALPKEIGKYPVIRELGHGACAVVYLALDSFNEREVAIKLANSEAFSDPTDGRRYRKLFLNEASLAGKLSHPNIVKVYDAVVDEKSGYIVMEYVSGGTLKPFCRPDNLLPIEKIVAIAYKCCMALDFAHKHGVIHRDIKPANILFGANGDIKITDFGAAQLSFSQQTQISGFLGSPAYMSPEQVQEKPLTTQTDIYSLGVVIYELLTGRLPFEAKNTYAMIHKILGDTPQPVETLRQDVPPRLAKIVERAMSKNPTTRYPGWFDFAKELADEFVQLERIREDIDEKEKFNGLRNLPFFREFRDDELWEVIRACSWELFKAGQCILREGDIGQALYILMQGEVRVSKGGQSLSTLRRGDCFGEISGVNRPPARRTATITAADDVLLVRVNTPPLEQLSEGCQLRFHRVFLQTLVERLSSAND